jgi:hypothetical protein
METVDTVPSDDSQSFDFVPSDEEYTLIVIFGLTVADPGEV